MNRGEKKGHDDVSGTRMTDVLVAFLAHFLSEIFISFLTSFDSPVGEAPVRFACAAH